MPDLPSSRPGAAPPRSQRKQPGDFASCKASLARQWQLRADQQGLLVATPPAQLYAVAATFGIASSTLAQAIATFTELPYLAQILPRDIRLGVLPVAFCRTHLAVALHHASAAHAFALCNPFDFALLDTLTQQASPSQPLQLFMTDPAVLTDLLENIDLATPQPEITAQTQTAQGPLMYDMLATVEPEGFAEIEVRPEYEILSQQEAEKIGQLPPIIRLVNLILSNAVKAGASDIHIEPQETTVQVRYRVDGMLIEALTVPKHLQASLVSRLKILAGLDISEHRKPQDGRSRLRFEQRRIDLRLSILPTQLGPKVVIRLLDSQSGLVQMDQLALRPAIRQTFERLLRNPGGMILVTGPTGSGKSTTLYAALNWLKSPTTNIVTVENPVEYHIPGITQVPIDVKAGMTFAAGLRSILRQDPDIIFVGEIRDRETASIALEAAQTGHLVLSTVHTNDAPSTITRLLNLDIEPFQISASLTGVLAQRLVRRLCPVCVMTAEPSAETWEQYGLSPTIAPGAQWKTAPGCPACAQSGFKGRVAIHELLEVTTEIRELIHQKAPDHALRTLAHQQGMRFLLEDGLAKAARGLTTLEEVLRIAPRPEARTHATRPAGAPAQTSEAAPALARAMSPAPGSTSPASPAVPHLLILEDDADTQALLRLLLERNGYAVTVVGDGIEALMQLGKQSFDLILSDINMPHLDGIQLLEIKTQKGVQAPLVFLTADSTEACEQKCLELGAVDYITKPIKKDVLLLRLKKALRI